jgi:hypothetical protein
MTSGMGMTGEMKKDCQRAKRQKRLITQHPSQDPGPSPRARPFQEVSNTAHLAHKLTIAVSLSDIALHRPNTLNASRIALIYR